MPASPTDHQPVIVLAGTTSGLAVVRSLGERGVPIVVADHSDRSYAGESRFVREVMRLPHPVTDEDAFVDALASQATRWSGSLLVPGSDETLVAISRAEERLASDFIVGAPPWPILRQVIEKRLTYEVADSVGVPVPRTVLPVSIADVERFAEAADYPCLVKPSEGHLFSAHFGTKMFSAANPAELLASYRRAVDAGMAVMLQEYIPGDDSAGANYNSYRIAGRTVAEFTAAKIRNAPPRHGSPRVVVGQRIPALAALGERLLGAIGLEGFSCIEFKRDPRDGSFKLMEVNARHNLSAWLAVRCGVDFPWIDHRFRTAGEQPAPTSMQDGVYWIDLPSDIKQTLRNLGREPMSPLSFLRPYARPHVFAVADRRDPRPLLRRLHLWRSRHR